MSLCRHCYEKSFFTRLVVQPYGGPTLWWSTTMSHDVCGIIIFSALFSNSFVELVAVRQSRTDRNHSMPTPTSLSGGLIPSNVRSADRAKASGVRSVDRAKAIDVRSADNAKFCLPMFFLNGVTKLTLNTIFNSSFLFLLIIYPFISH